MKDLTIRPETEIFRGNNKGNTSVYKLGQGFFFKEFQQFNSLGGNTKN